MVIWAYSSGNKLTFEIIAYSAARTPGDVHRRVNESRLWRLADGWYPHAFHLVRRS